MPARDTSTKALKAKAATLALALTEMVAARDRAIEAASELERIVDEGSWPFTISGTMDISQRAYAIRRDLGGDPEEPTDSPLSDVASLAEEARETVDVIEFLLGRNADRDRVAA